MPEINENILVHIIEFGSVFSNLWIFAQALFCPLQEGIFKYFIGIIILYGIIFTFFSAQEMPRISFRYCDEATER